MQTAPFQWSWSLKESWGTSHHVNEPHAPCHRGQRSALGSVLRVVVWHSCSVNPVSPLLIYKSGGNCITPPYQIKEIAPYKQDLYKSLWVIDPRTRCESSLLCVCTHMFPSESECSPKPLNSSPKTIWSLHRLISLTTTCVCESEEQKREANISSGEK